MYAHMWRWLGAYLGYWVMLGAISGLDIRWGRPVQVWGQFEAGLGV